MQPAVISVTGRFPSIRAPSMEVSPYSFSMIATLPSQYGRILLMKVVLPDPKNPETTSILI